MRTITNKFKIALVAVGLLTIGTVSAQQITGDATIQYLEQAEDLSIITCLMVPLEL